ncbi:rhomboid family intramembrane serine protease, partial [Candidatus Micrarchaeota archaeon]|nr:rhomboid family intramembrane serine protease [Candidatus Micrarchaeota archaeon]
MRLPFATIFLSLLVVGTYYVLSNGTFYISNAEVQQLGFQLYNKPAGFFSHTFIHVGILHLIGNLLPLILFAVLLESVLSSFDVLLIFFSSGVVASLLFSLLNTNTYLVGASAAISGLMSAATALKPKKSLLLLVASTLLLVFLFFPLFSYLSEAHTKQLVHQTQELKQNITNLIKENKTIEASQVNQTLQVIEKKAAISVEGKQRESSTPTSFIVHVFGAFVGILYVYLFKKDKLQAGIIEFEELG